MELSYLFPQNGVPPVSGAQMAALYRQDLSSFIKKSFMELNPQTPYLHNWHIDLIAYKLMQVERGEIKRLIINLPPRNLKSIAASVAFVAWMLGRNPSAKIMCSSFSDELCVKLASDTRQLMLAPWYAEIFPETKLSAKRTAVSDFSTTKNGNRLAVSTGGSITGRGADVLIIDDPIKPDEALSDTVRKNTNNWFDGTAYTRLDSKHEGAIIIIMQRLHLDDLVGHVLERGGWDLVSLPAIAEDDMTYEYERLGRKVKTVRKAGTPLHGERESLETLAGIRANLGEFAFACQYQQSPVPLGGGLIKDEWIHYYRPDELPTNFEMIVQSWDTASKANQFSDYSVGVTLGLKNKVIYVLDVYRNRLEFPGLKQAVLDKYRQYKPQHVLVEDAASGTSLVQDLNPQGIYCIKPIKPKGDKQTRLFAHQAIFESARIRFPKDAPWLANCVRELTSFPQAKHDDQVDAISQALGFMRERLEEPGMLTYMRMQVEEIRRQKGLPID